MIAHSISSGRIKGGMVLIDSVYNTDTGQYKVVLSCTKDVS